MKSHTAAFEDAFKNLADNHTYTKQEMLVVLKAYEVYSSDLSLEKPFDDVGWLDSSYDIALGIFHSPMQTIIVRDLYNKMPEDWDFKNGRLRLSEIGYSYIDENADLRESAKSILGGVSHVRRG